MRRQSTITTTPARGVRPVTKDAFPYLDTREITSCLLECDFNVSLELIAKPTSDFIIRLYTHFLETFMGIDNLYERARELAMRRLEVLKNGDDNASDEGAEQNGGSNLEENSIEPSATDEILTLFR